MQYWLLSNLLLGNIIIFPQFSSKSIILETRVPSQLDINYS